MKLHNNDRYMYNYRTSKTLTAKLVYSEFHGTIKIYFVIHVTVVIH